MDEDVQAALFGVPALKDLLDFVIIANVAAFDEGRSDRRGERADAALDERRHRAEADFGALVVESFSDSPGDRMVVCDAEYERLLTLEQAVANAVVGGPGVAVGTSTAAAADRARARTAAAADRARAGSGEGIGAAADSCLAGVVGAAVRFVSFMSSVGPPLSAAPGRWRVGVSVSTTPNACIML